MFRANEFILLFDASQAEPSRAAPFYNDRGLQPVSHHRPDPANELLHASSSDWNPASDAQAPALIPFDYPAATTGVRQFGTLNWVRFAIDPTGGAAARPP